MEALNLARVFVTMAVRMALRSFPRWSLGWRRAPAMGAQPHHLVVEPKPQVTPEHKSQVASPAQPDKDGIFRKKRDPGEPRPWWWEVLRDLNGDELRDIDVNGLTREEANELTLRTMWAEEEEEWEDPGSPLDPAVERRQAQLLNAYARVLDELAVLEGKEAPSSSDRRLLYDMHHVGKTFMSAYRDRVTAAYERERPRSTLWSVILWTHVASEVMEEVIGEYNQRIAAAKAKQRGSQALSSSSESADGSNCQGSPTSHL